MPMLEEKFKAVIDERVKAAEEKITKEDKRMMKMTTVWIGWILCCLTSGINQ